MIIQVNYINKLLILNSSNFIMSASRKNTNLLSLRELHLTPHFIYLVQQSRLEPRSQFALQIWKNDEKIGVETDMRKNDAIGSQKHASLQFEKIRLVFDVEALFQQNSEASIVLKLTQKDSEEQPQKIIDQFHLHILYYNYEFSKDKFVRFKQNSVGKINNYIFNYSFSAIYGERLESLLFRKHQKAKNSVLLQDLCLAKKDSKYGLIVKEENFRIDTIFLIEKVAENGIQEMKKSRKVENNPESALQKIVSTQYFQDPDEDGLQNGRKAARSILDDVPLQKDDSTLTQNDLIEQIRAKSKNISTLVLILISSYLIFYLMHPIRKI